MNFSKSYMILIYYYSFHVMSKITIYVQQISRKIFSERKRERENMMYLNKNL